MLACGLQLGRLNDGQANTGPDARQTDGGGEQGTESRGEGRSGGDDDAGQAGDQDALEGARDEPEALQSLADSLRRRLADSLRRVPQRVLDALVQVLAEGLHVGMDLDVGPTECHGTLPP